MTDSAVDLSRLWDVVIIGTGMGGATVGRELALRGLNVLFVERGKAVRPGRAISDAPVAPEERVAAGWWPHPVSQRREDGTRDRFFAPVGCALGGSSIHYAAALERMAPSDFDALPTAHGVLPPWVTSFDEFLPYYHRAEQLFRVSGLPGTGSELRFSAWDRALMERLRERGLNPEPLHVAMQYDEGCLECIGVVCPRGCKADARTVCLDEALRQRDCAVLDECEVLALDSDRSRVTGVRARRHGREIEVRARIVVLSAGAMHSPQILLQSANAHWPHGLANSSDQVGRNLMFHTTDIFAVFAPRRLDRRARQKKSISLRDFYVHEGRRLGYVQSLGLDAGAGLIAVHFKNQLRRRGVRHERLLSALVKLPVLVAARVLGEASLFVGATEDDPDPENRIFLDPEEPNGAGFNYVIREDLRQRANALHDLLRRNLHPWKLYRLSDDLPMNYGHPSGTCRFGDDPSTSVLDRNCRAHDIENLYVVDSSFMPRSGAVNPSLTIAANALRVAPRIAAAVAAQPA